MRRLAQLRSLLSALVGRRRMERDLDDELSFHLEARARDLAAQDHSPHSAAARARAELGDAARWRQDAREARGLRWLDELTGDCRIAVRMMRRNPAFAVTAVLTLAIGIGGATAIFGKLNALLWKALRDFNPEDTSAGNYRPGGLVAPGFFTTMKLPLLVGRDFTWSERSLGRQRVVIVNEAFVKKFFSAGSDPVCQTVRLGRDCPANPGFAIIVGVVADSRTEPRRDAEPMVYQMFGSPARPVTVILQTTGDPGALLPTIRQSMAQFNTSVPLFGETRVIDLLGERIRQERLLMRLLIPFGAFALLLCCLGIFGLLSYMVGGRTAEIGVRRDD